MLAFILLAALCGAVLAFRYRAFMIYPAILCGCAITLTVGLAARTDRWTIFMTLIAVSFAIQFGYVFGMIARSSMAASRASSMRRRKPEPDIQQAA